MRFKSRFKRSLKYKPLRRGSGEIRLIILQPAESSTTKVECKILHTTLTSGIEYIALSYAWGDPNLRRPIFIDSHQVEVTNNLEDALRQFRRRDSPISLWVDAICINQEDLDERSHQVQIMKDIYSTAVGVFAWIGRADSASSLAYNFIGELVTKVLEDNSSATQDTSAWIAQHVSPLLEHGAIRALADILHRPWFSRAWIVQEVVLAKDAKIWCGDSALPLNYFIIAAGAIYMYGATIMEVAAAGMTHISHPEACGLAIDRYDKLNRGAYNIRTIATSIAERAQARPLATFYQIIRRFRPTECADPLDKIYAFLGLASDSHDEAADLPVDYRMRPEDLFRSLTRSHLEKYKNLDILNDCSGMTRLDGFPSWTVHYREHHPSAEMLFLESGEEVVFRAGSGTDPSFSFDATGTVILLKGLDFDQVTQFGAVSDLLPEKQLNGEPYSPTTVQHQWQELVGLRPFFQAIESDVDTELENWIENAFYPTGCLKVDAFLRTLTMNPVADQTKVNFFDPKSNILMEDKMTKPELGPAGENDGYLRARCGLTCSQRRFFVTSKGYYGLGPATIEAGDKISVFFGSKTPLIVREEDGYHLLVGEAYVHGLMSGEAMADWRAGKLEAQDFALR
jgi:hypothetical protein